MFTQILRRLEITPSTFNAEEIKAFDAAQRETLLRLGILKPSPSATTANCPECGEYRSDVIYIASPNSDASTAYLTCAQCGLVAISLKRLQRWSIDRFTLVKELAGAAGLSGNVQSLVADRLWYMGRARWGGRQRDICWTTCRSPRCHLEVKEAVLRRPKHLLFVASESAAHYWGVTDAAIFVSERYWSLTGTQYTFDIEAVESRLADLNLIGATLKIGTPQKRQTRAALIERLTELMKDHLLAARDHAFDSLDRTGTPTLLPRPTQKQLATLAKASPSAVSRCFYDSAARELKLLWDLATDIDQLMRYKS